MQGIMRQFFHNTILIITAMFLMELSCSFSTERDASPLEFRFAITGSTFAESPFRGRNDAVEVLIKRINEDNPLFVVHLGDIVHGGKSWMGISAGDIERQFRDFKNQFALLRPLLFTVKGEKDMLDADFAHYTRHTKRPPYYSFNYGPAHCVVLDTCEEGKAAISASQLEWLKKDLARHRRAHVMFVFGHYPFCGNDATAPENISERVPVKEANEVHAIISKYPVKAVFSGHGVSFSRTVRDGIFYITAGCDFSAIRTTPHQKAKNATHYYVVDYRNGEITILPKSIE